MLENVAGLPFSNISIIQYRVSATLKTRNRQTSAVISAKRTKIVDPAFLHYTKLNVLDCRNKYFSNGALTVSQRWFPDIYQLFGLMHFIFELQDVHYTCMLSKSYTKQNVQLYRSFILVTKKCVVLS